MIPVPWNAFFRDSNREKIFTQIFGNLNILNNNYSIFIIVIRLLSWIPWIQSMVLRLQKYTILIIVISFKGNIAFYCWPIMLQIAIYFINLNVLNLIKVTEIYVCFFYYEGWTVDSNYWFWGYKNKQFWLLSTPA